MSVPERICFKSPSDDRETGIRKWECGMRKEKKEDRRQNLEVGISIIRKVECGMRNVEVKMNLRA